MNQNIIAFLASICVIFILGRLFLFPIKKILKLVLNSILGGIILYIINIIGGMFNFYIGINIFTCIMVGILGIPGIICLIIVKVLIG